MLGGLYKKTTYLNEYRKTHKNLVVVDSGDLLNEHYEIKPSFVSSARLKGDIIAKVYKSIGIDAVNVGELELALSLDYLKELEKKYDFPFVSANLVDDKKQLLFKPYVIKNLDNMKVGIIGIMGNTADIISKLKEVPDAGLSVLDPLETAQSLVAELKDKVDFIIVMTHQHIGRNWVIARKIDGIDVIVGGHHKQKLKTPYNANDTYIVQSGEKGQYQGLLEITLASDGTKTAENTLVPIGDEIPNDAEVKAMIDDYNLQVTRLYAAQNAPKGESVPPKSIRCSECHEEVFEIWKKSDHAKAFQTLIDKGRQFNPDCLVCHTTRFEEPGGFTMENQEEELRNVQCESCHGDSASHLEDPGNLYETKPTVETCVKCHTEHRCPDFEENYSQEWEKIKH